MPFAYYAKLSARQKKTYRASDAIAAVVLPGAAALAPLVDRMRETLAGEDRLGVQAASQKLADGMTRALNVPPVRVQVFAARPTADWGELHGLYTPGVGRGKPLVSVWMRTAQQRRPVAWKTFLRTLLHELGHHLDYELFGFPETFHTEGFYKRESSLFHQLVTDVQPAADAARGKV